jgi:prepilin-type N-terminal cleavage/methylation domain-containing protein
MTPQPRHLSPSGSPAGFTLIEVLLAVAIAGMAMTAVVGAFWSTIQARDIVRVQSQSTEDGERVLALLDADLRGLWTYNIADNKVFLGRNMDIAGYSSDRLDFLTATRAYTPVQSTTAEWVRAPICEVGYWLRENPRLPGKLELWRREDPLVDDDLRSGGTFQLVCDRIESFNVEYFETLGHEAEPRFEWDSSVDDMLPRRIRVEFTIERRLGNRNRVAGAEIDDFEKINKRYVRDFVLDTRLVEILQPQIGMVPVAPAGPATPDDLQGGGPIGPAGPGGPLNGLGGGGPGTLPPGAEIRGQATTQTTGGGRPRAGGQNPLGGGAGGGQGGGSISLEDLLRGGGGGSLGDLLGGRGGGGGGR